MSDPTPHLDKLLFLAKREPPPQHLDVPPSGYQDHYRPATRSAAEYISVPAGHGQSWRVRPGSIGEGMAHYAAAHAGNADDIKRAEQAVLPHTHMPEEFHHDAPSQPKDRASPFDQLKTRSADYSRVEHGKLERVMGHTLTAHLQAHHPFVYSYLQQGRDIEQLEELHHTDHERHAHMDHDVTDLNGG